MTHNNLRLVTVSSDYREWPSTMPVEAKGEAFFAYSQPDGMTGYSRLLLPKEKGLAAGFYASTGDGEENVGWNIHDRHLSNVEGTEAPVSPETSEVAPEATVEPWKPTRGDRVRVTALPERPERWGMTPDLVGQAATFEQTDAYDEERAHLVRVDGGASYWVKDVAPFLPTTVEEFEAALTAAKASVVPSEEIREARRQERRAANEEFETWKRMANETAIQYADDNSLCSEFDRCMLAIGLEPRDSFEREWEVTVSYSYTVTARDEETAQELTSDAIANGYISGDWECEEM